MSSNKNIVDINRLDKFENWLRNKGCVILPVTNAHEALRFKGSEVGAVYKTGSVSGDYTKNAYHCYLNNIQWHGSPIKTARSNKDRKDKLALIKRDGNKCMLCGHKMVTSMTVEHLVELSQGGSDDLSNKVLLHADCNHSLQGKSIAEKVNIFARRKK